MTSAPVKKPPENFYRVVIIVKERRLFQPQVLAGIVTRGELGNLAELKPAPFEITIETPRKAPPELQTKAATAALNKIIEEYRPFLASQQNI